MTQDGPPSANGAGANPEPVVDVLVVDDDEALRGSWAMMLEDSGYSVVVAEDGDIALDILDEREVGMVLLDLKMPRVDGLSVLESLKTPQLVVMVSAFALDDATHRRADAKVVTYLEKPVSPQRLLSVVGSTLGRDG